MGNKVVFILGIGRSGSTLLDLMLGSHPACFSLGEISKLPEIFRRDGTPATFSPGSTFWAQHFTQAEAERLAIGLSNHRVHPRIPLKLERFIRELLGKDAILNPYSLLFDKIQKPILIDSSKYAHWVSQKLLAREFRDGTLDSYLIHLVRDGRAVLNSYLRAFPGLQVPEFSQRWLQEMEASQALFNQFPADRRLLIQYEAMATQTEMTLQRACAMLGIAFLPEMMEYWKQDHHHIAGSQGTRALITRYKGQTLPEKVTRIHGDHYQHLDLSIKLDLRWQKELAPGKLEEFYRLIGDRNRPFEWT